MLHAEIGLVSSILIVKAKTSLRRIILRSEWGGLRLVQSGTNEILL